MRIDPFFEKQPPKKFIDDLMHPVHSEPPKNFGMGRLCENDTDAGGIYLRDTFPGGDDLLRTIYDDFNSFIAVTKIGGKRFPLDIRCGSVEGRESYRISVTESGCTVTAEDTEGVRRALVYIEGEMTKREGAYLPSGEITRRPYIKSRITRGFFSPTNRAPKFGDELLDDIDYYPDEYLNRLVHSNTNGLWIYTSFRALVTTPYFNDDEEKAKKRIEKLRRVVEKCKKYGIKVYVFAIEPHGLRDEEAAAHPELISGPEAEIWGWNPICLRREDAKNYLLLAVEALFRSVPDLGGYIDITAGERVTSCPSAGSYRLCPRCGKFSRGENLAYTVDLIKEGIRRAGTGAEFISWTYGHRYWEFSDIDDYVRAAPSDVILMQNFEDRGYNEQLGRPRIAYDYWLSYVGPSLLFDKTAETAKKSGKELYAKMQVCCSHELATVPYIPVPGILYDKYRLARECGVTGIMECWYFGNYPSLMSRAAGELSFIDSFSSKEEFLLDFAARLYGRTLAEGVARAWSLFEEGYINYPTNIMFSYYGPMHDGVVWELSLLPKNNAMPRSWQLPDVPDGDRIGECLFRGHTPDEAISLAFRMKKSWDEGLRVLPLDEDDELTTVAEAIGTLFSSGLNILSFYDMRKTLGEERKDPKKTLDLMRGIVFSEIENSEKMIGLCQKDPRLGYHSEAEGFKFFPEKLEVRIEKLKGLLSTEFAEVEKRISELSHPLAYYYAEGENAYILGDEIAHGAEVKLAEGRSFSARIIGDEIELTLKTRPNDDAAVYYEFALFEPECGVIIDYNAKGTIHTESVEQLRRGLRLDPGATSHQSVAPEQVDEELSKHRLLRREDGYTLYTRIPQDKWRGHTAIKARIRIGNSLWHKSSDPVRTLGKDNFSPDEFGFMMPKC